MAHLIVNPNSNDWKLQPATKQMNNTKPLYYSLYTKLHY